MSRQKKKKLCLVVTLDLLHVKRCLYDDDCDPAARISSEGKLWRCLFSAASRLEGENYFGGGWNRRGRRERGERTRQSDGGGPFSSEVLD